MTLNRPLRVFLCHSSNDKPAVRELYQKLRAESWIQPWLDEEELYPGQDWNLEIEKAVEVADVILVCLSKGSTTKEGYVQREIRIALDYADYKPEGTLYIIPVRLEECDPPRRLRVWQYADYFEGSRERGFQRLLVSLKRRAESLAPEEVDSSGTGNKPMAHEPPDHGIPESSFHAEIKRIEKATAETSAIQGEQADRNLKEDKKPIIDKKSGNGGPKTQEMSESVRQQPSLNANTIILSNGMELVHVMAGPFLMGTKTAASLLGWLIDFQEAEKPQHLVDIPYAYWMARFPVTNQLYQEYVIAKALPHPVLGWEAKKDHPVVNVSWEDAIAYCAWLNELFKGELPSNLVVRLPTEAEWEKAARGEYGREYPWGNLFDDDKCNTRKGGKGSTTSVGLYSPQGDSQYRCADMAGNVWEWTHSIMKDYPYNATDGREDEKASGFRVMRGGAFNTFGSTRCAYRVALYDNTVRMFNCGFRVVAAPALST
jgi:formylglycine-generating enzyme required for sulfatase activity